MKIKVWGVRGTIPTTSTDTRKYGGNTSCVAAEADDWLLILDAGSGIQNLNRELAGSSKRIDILLTHLHIDHIQGLGVFAPLFNPEADIHIWGPAGTSQDLRTRLGRYFSPPLFPVYFRNLRCKLELHEIGNSEFTIGPFSIKSLYVFHPGPTVGYRIEYNQKAFTYLPDHEFALSSLAPLVKDRKWMSGSELAWRADLLLHDAQYTIEEYAARKGWGHSAMAHTIQFAMANEVKKLLMAHHDPLHNDDELEELYQKLQNQFKGKLPFELAAEGSVYAV